MRAAWALAAAGALLAIACEPPPRAGGDPAYPHAGVYPDRVYDDPSDEIYDPEALPRFDLEISPAAQDALARDPRADAPARLTYRGETLDVTVHLRGEASFRTLAGKPSFKVKIDELVPDQTLRGLGGLVLKNGMQDHTLTSECLSYELAAAMSVPAPRCNDALVWVNGAYFGVYVNVEATDKRFLVRHFGTSKGNLYEEAGADFVEGAAARFERKNHEERTDRSDLETLIDTLAHARVGSFADDVAGVLEVDAFLRFAALELLAGHWDGYAYKNFLRNNFLIYGHPKTGRFHFLPTGMDQTFRSTQPLQLTHRAVDDAQVYLEPEDAHGMVLQGCLANGACRKRYAEIVAGGAAAFEALGVRARAAARFARLAASLEADPRREVSDEELAARQRELFRYADGRVAALRRTLKRGVLE